MRRFGLALNLNLPALSTGDGLIVLLIAAVLYIGVRLAFEAPASLTGPNITRTPAAPRVVCPMVPASGRVPAAPVYPPGPPQHVCGSSIASRAPCLSVSSRSASWKPGSGWTMPTFVRAGSVRPSGVVASPCVQLRFKVGKRVARTSGAPSLAGSYGWEEFTWRRGSSVSSWRA